MVLYANKSRTRIISLKQRLIENSSEEKSVSTYLQEMRGIADDLALVDSPVDEADLVLHILHLLGNEFKEICAAVRARDTPISFDELHDKLVDYEMQQKNSTKLTTPVIPTANYTQRGNRTMTNNRGATQALNNNHSRPRKSFDQKSLRFPNNLKNNGSPWPPKNSGTTSSFNKNAICNYCVRNGHHTKDCRSLARFLVQTKSHLWQMLLPLSHLRLRLGSLIPEQPIMSLQTPVIYILFLIMVALKRSYSVMVQVYLFPTLDIPPFILILALFI